MTPLTVAESRAILIADEALQLSYEERLASGQTFGIEELNAWAKLVESATDRIAAYARPISSAVATDEDGFTRSCEVMSSPYPGGNEPDFQTFALEALMRGEKRKTP